MPPPSHPATHLVQADLDPLTAYGVACPPPLQVRCAARLVLGGLGSQSTQLGLKDRTGQAADRQAGRQARVKEGRRQAGRQAGRRAGKQADRKRAGRQAGRQESRQADQGSGSQEASRSVIGAQVGRPGLIIRVMPTWARWGPQMWER